MEKNTETNSSHNFWSLDLLYLQGVFFVTL